MLVLTRKVGESIVIAENIVVMVTALSGSRVKMGIQAPSAVHIARQEVADQMRPVRGASPSRSGAAGPVLAK
jgi:carbon storage regulator